MLAMLFVLFLALPAVAQVSNDNEDGVYKMPASSLNGGVVKASSPVKSS